MSDEAIPFQNREIASPSAWSRNDVNKENGEGV